MRGRLLIGKLAVGALVAAPLMAVAASPVHAAGETETFFSYASQSGDYIGQGRSATLTAPTAFSLSGTAGSVRFRADAGTEYWDVTLAAPKGQQLTTGVYENALRAPFNDAAPGLSATTTGRGCNTVKGRFTIFGISADPAGDITSLDASFTQFCDGQPGALNATVKYAAPYVVPIVLTSSAPTSVEGQNVTLTARVSPGTGSVTFYDGETVIGQGSPDSAALARFTTSRLAPGSHWLSARQGTATSARFSQVVTDGSTSLSFTSVAGDYIGQGASVGLASPAATITASGSPGAVRVLVQNPDLSDYWDVDLAAPQGGTLAVGTYTGAERAPFRSAGHPGLEVTGNGRGCNTLTGSFTIDRISFAPDSTLASLDARFTQYCEGNTAAPLTGRVRVNAPTQVVGPSTTTLTGTASSAGQVTLTASVSGASGVPTGTVTFAEGTTTLGSAALDANGRAVLTTARSVGSHQVTATYQGNAVYTSSSASTTVIVPAASKTSLVVSKTLVKAGKSVTFTATVDGGTTSATGTVTLYDGVEPIRTVALGGGVARIDWVGVGKSTHSFTARYSGDASHAGSTSGAVSVRVN